MSLLPIAVHAGGVAVLVVGGGAVATRKASAFLEAGASVRVVAPEISAELGAMAKLDPRLELVAREYTSRDLDGASLIVAATSSAGLNERIAADGAAAGKLVNRADDSAGGSFSTMAVHRAGDLTVGVAAGVPAAAVRVRDAIAERFDERYSEALLFLAATRASMLDRGEREQWRAVADDLVSPDFCAAVESGAFKARIAAWR